MNHCKDNTVFTIPLQIPVLGFTAAAKAKLAEEILHILLHQTSVDKETSLGVLFGLDLSIGGRFLRGLDLGLLRGEFGVHFFAQRGEGRLRLLGIRFDGGGIVPGGGDLSLQIGLVGVGVLQLSSGFLQVAVRVITGLGHVVLFRVHGIQRALRLFAGVVVLVAGADRLLQLRPEGVDLGAEASDLAVGGAPCVLDLGVAFGGAVGCRPLVGGDHGGGDQAQCHDVQLAVDLHVDAGWSWLVCCWLVCRLWWCLCGYTIYSRRQLLLAVFDDSRMSDERGSKLA
mmetsp:Transcript_7751/g.22474  ORF Transcript_7751/g.22474 Transcript_7751/m.22474 type:complete len:284 (-) Transcript_7751:90-941(-)